MKKGQISFEYIVLLGLLLIILIPTFYYTSIYTSQNVKISKAEDLVTSLAKAADEVYASSPGTKKYDWIDVPNGVRSSSVNLNEINIKVNLFGKDSDVTAITRSTVTGNIPIAKGNYRIPVELLDSGVVLIGNGTDTTIPAITWTSPGGSTCNPVTLRTTTDEAAVCRFDTSDLAYASMADQMEGNTLGHSYNLGVQLSGSHNYYVRCKDTIGNIMPSSTVISYNIVC